MTGTVAFTWALTSIFRNHLFVKPLFETEPERGTKKT